MPKRLAQNLSCEVTKRFPQNIFTTRFDITIKESQSGFPKKARMKCAMGIKVAFA